MVWAVLWRDADTGRQTSRALPTEADARELRGFLNANEQSFSLAAQAASKLRSTAPTVAEIIALHINMLTAVGPDTRAKYERVAARHITPALGSIPVDTLTRHDVAQWMNSLQVSAKTKKNTHSILSAALNSAVRDGIIPANVSKGIAPSGIRATREPVFCTAGEATIITNATPDWHQPFVDTLFNSGARFSEATACEVRDLTITDHSGSPRATMSIVKAWKDTPEGWVIGPPKTRRGRRTVALPGHTSALLDQMIRERDLKPRDLLFTDPKGRALRNRDFHRLAWQPTLDAVEDQLRARPRIHDLRHTHALWLIAAGVPLTVIQRRLGHESIQTTSDLYGHLADDADAAAAAALD